MSSEDALKRALLNRVIKKEFYKREKKIGKITHHIQYHLLLETI